MRVSGPQGQIDVLTAFACSQDPCVILEGEGGWTWSVEGFWTFIILGLISEYPPDAKEAIFLLPV